MRLLMVQKVRKIWTWSKKFVQDTCTTCTETHPVCKDLDIDWNFTWSIILYTLTLSSFRDIKRYRYLQQEFCYLCANKKWQDTGTDLQSAGQDFTAESSTRVGSLISTMAVGGCRRRRMLSSRIILCIFKKKSFVPFVQTKMSVINSFCRAVRACKWHSWLQWWPNHWIPNVGLMSLLIKVSLSYRLYQTLGSQRRRFR